MKGAAYMELTEKRAAVLRALYRETGLEIWDFMDKTDLDFAYIDRALNGELHLLSESGLEAFARGFDLSPQALTAYLEIGNFF